MSLLPAPLTAVRPAFLTRVTPVSRLTAGTIWLAACLVTLDPIVPLRLTAAAILALVLWSGLPLRRIPARLSPIGLAVLSITAFSILLAGANSDPQATEVARLGPLRITAEAVWAGLAVGLRLVVIALTTLLVFGPSDPTRLADSLAQQWRVPDRFAYGSLASLRMAPLMAVDWTTIGAARRLRGISPRGPVARLRDFAGRLLVILVSAIRRAERVALAMDARGFDCGLKRSHFREVRVGWRDWLAIAVAAAVAAAALAAGR
jgi:energy-coupling factor transport system permease protein